MGEVYAAVDDSLDREVAIKVLGKAVNIEPHRRRFLREARLAARLNHPNIASIHEVGDSDGRLYIVMELLEGQSLRALLAARRLDEAEALSIARDVARALARAHAGDVIHRDIKPENIFITRPSPDVLMAKVLDFGLARDELVRKRTDQENTATDLTGPGEACGTAGYLAPEQARGLAVDVRADIFSFGAVVYEMLTAQRAFDGKNQLSRMLAVVKQEPPPLRSVVPDLEIDPAFEAVITKCLSKSPDDRYADGAALSSALEQIARTTSQRLLAAVDSSSRNLESVKELPPSSPGSASPMKAISTMTPAPSTQSNPPRRRPSSAPPPTGRTTERPLWPFLLAGIFALTGIVLIIVTIVTRPSPPKASTAFAMVTAAPSPPPSNATGARAMDSDEPTPELAPPSGSPTKNAAPPVQRGAHPSPPAFTKLPPSITPTPTTSTVAASALATPPAPTSSPIEPPKFGVVHLQQNQDVMTVVVDGEHRRVKENTITLPCGRHKIRVGFKEERIVDVPCGGVINL